MLRQFFAAMAVLAICLPGCSFVYYGARNIMVVPARAVDEQLTRVSLKKEARKAWQNIENEHGKKAFCDDYRKGFLAGYQSYVDAGGNGLAPPVPPIHYQKLRYENPAGTEAAHQWFAGYEHGSMAARTTGRRDYRIVPSSSPGLYELPPTFRGMTENNYSQPMPTDYIPGEINNADIVGPTETLPPPRMSNEGIVLPIRP